MSNQCMFCSWYVNQTLIYIWAWFVLLFHFTVLKKTWALTACAPWVAWWMSWVAGWPSCISANRPWPPSPAPKTLGDAVRSDKWHLWCHDPLFMQPQRGHVHKSHTRHSEERLEQFDLQVLKRVTQQLVDLMYTGMDAFLTPSIALWVSDCLLSYFHLLPSSTVLFFLVFQERGGIKPQPIYGSFPRWS